MTSSLTGRVIRSERQADVDYELERCIGEGGMGRAYLARRRTEHGSAPVVVKVMHPDVASGSVSPDLLAVKEAVALGRLNEQLPPSPFVVRLVDAGSANLHGDRPNPWLAIEYVHGGLEGTTLEERVTYSVHRTGFGFDGARAAHFVRCAATGLGAIHAVSVIHRDLTPGNVLCCGFGEAEIFKIADFGVARPFGLPYTFGRLRVGTLGYLAPDAADPAAGPAADVFSFAAVVYYVLTGERYFEADTPQQAMSELLAPSRRSIRDHATLVPELFAQPKACAALDAALAQATRVAPAQRPRTARQFASALLPWLGTPGAAPRSSRRLLSAVSSERATSHTRYHWTVRSQPRDDMVIGCGAWDTDGHALGLSTAGAWFWDGQVWRDAKQLLLPLGGTATFAQRHDAGGWLLGGFGPALAVVGAPDVSPSLPSPATAGTLSLACGRVGELLVAVETRPDHPPQLWCASNRRWLEPFVVPGLAHINALTRLDDARWVIAGRWRSGGGFAAIYTPLTGTFTLLAVPALRAFIAGTSAVERGVALLVGSGGVVLRLEGDTVAVTRVPGDPDLGATAMDVMAGEWATSVGQIFRRDAGGAWQSHWHEPSWHAPFISLIADVGLVLGMTADGAILEGRSTGA